MNILNKWQDACDETELDELIDDIDLNLISLEDILHGESGNLITQIRIDFKSLINKIRKK